MANPLLEGAAWGLFGMLWMVGFFSTAAFVVCLVGLLGHAVEQAWKAVRRR